MNSGKKEKVQPASGVRGNEGVGEHVRTKSRLALAGEIADLSGSAPNEERQ
jgi:hypothetical protein